MFQNLSVTLKLSMSATFLLGSSTLALAQDSDHTSTVGALTISTAKTETHYTTQYRDDSGISPDRLWVTELEENMPVAIDGPHEGQVDVTRMNRENGGQTTVVTNPLGHVWKFENDELGRPRLFTDPNGRATSFAYSGDYLISYTTNADNEFAATTVFSYSEENTLSRVDLASGKSIETPLNLDGTYTPETGKVMSNLMNVLSLPNKIIVSKSKLGSGGSSLPILSLIHLSTDQQFDDNGRVISGVDANGGVLRVEYDQYGNVAQVRDARGVITNYEYDGFNKVVLENSSERGETRYSYDSAGNMVKRVLAGGLVHKRSYDALNRVTREVMKQNGVDKKVTHYKYDNCQNGIGRLCEVVSDGTVTRYKYDVQGKRNKVSVKHPGDDEFSTTLFHYGVGGRLERLRYPTGLNVRYHYDTEGDVVKVMGQYDVGENKTKFVIAKNIKINPDTRFLDQLTFGNNLKTVFKYDEDNRLKKQTIRQNSVAVDRSSYEYSANGHIKAINRLDGDNSQTFVYDDVGQLISEQRGGISEAATSNAYTYDEVGNRTAWETGDKRKTYTYDSASNRLSQIRQQDTSFDIRGNLIEDRSGNRLFEYDVTNRMTAFYKQGELKSTYAYNSQGQRIRKTLHGTSNNSENYESLHFSYTPEGGLLSEYGKNSQNSRTFVREYVWLGDRPIAQIERRIKPDGTTRKAEVTYIHTDHLNTPRSGTDEAGQKVWSWESDPYGAIKADKDPDGNGMKTNIRLRFPGQYFDQESGLHYNHNRDYDPRLGRYIQSDPIGLHGGVNRYAYVLGNPIGLTDKKGLSADPCSINQSTGQVENRTLCDYIHYSAYQVAIANAALYDEIVTYGTRTTPYVYEPQWVPTSFDSLGVSTPYTQYIPLDYSTGAYPITTPTPQTPAVCENSIEGMNLYLEEVLGRRGFSDDFAFVRIADRFADLPSSVRDYYGGEEHFIGTAGWHHSNLRLPSPEGTNGGYHLHTEVENGPVFVHYDNISPLHDLYGHGMEVGAVPLPDFGNIDMVTFTPLGPVRFNQPGGPSTPEEIAEEAETPEEDLAQFCESIN